MSIETSRSRMLACLVTLVALITVAAPAADSKPDLFNTEEIRDESTLDIKILQDWHVDQVTGTTRQKLIEITVAEWWPGQDYRIPVRMIVPLKCKAKGFRITGGSPSEFSGAGHAQGNAAVFSSVELVDWMLGFSKGK